MVLPIVRNITQGIFTLLLLITIFGYARRRDPIRRDIMLMFASVSVSSLFELLSTLFGVHSEPVSTFVSLLGVAQPLLMLRLLGYFSRVPRSLLVGSALLTVGTWVGYVALPKPFEALAALLIVLDFVLFDGYSMIVFFRRAVLTSGVTQARLRFVAAGSGFLALTLAIAGSQLLFPRAGTSIQIVAQLSASVTGIVFFLGLAPPRSLTRYWQLGRLFVFLTEVSERRPFSSARSLLELLCVSAVDAVGAVASRVLIRSTAGEEWSSIRRYAPGAAESEETDFEPPVDPGVAERFAEAVSAGGSFRRREMPPALEPLLLTERPATVYVVPLDGTADRSAFLIVELAAGSLFPEDDRFLLRLLGEQAGISLANMRLVDELQGRSDALEITVAERTEALEEQNLRLGLLHRISAVADEALDIETPLKTAVELVCAHYRFSAANAFVPDRQSYRGHLVSRAWRDIDPDRFDALKRETENVRTALELRGVIDAVRSGRAVWFPALSQVPDFVRARSALDAGITSVLFVPLFVRGEVRGVLEFFDDAHDLASAPRGNGTERDRRPFGAADLDFFGSLGTQLGRIIERSFAQHEVQIREERFRRFFEQQPSYCYLLSSDGTILHANRTALQATGYPATELAGRSAASLVDDASRDRIVRRISEVAGGGGAKQDECDIVTASGEHLAVVLNIAWLGPQQPGAGNDGTNGETAGPNATPGPNAPAEPGSAPDTSATMIMVQTDVTELRRARSERDRLFSLIDDMIAVIGFDGTIRQTNPAWQKVLGWSAEELHGRKTEELLHPEDANRSGDVQVDIRSGGTIGDYETRYRTRGGDYRWLSWSAVGVPEDEIIFAVARDITERKEMESKLKEFATDLERKVAERTAHLEALNEELAAFSYSVSHDLRAPLRAVDGFGQALLEDYNDRLDEEGRDFLNRIRRETQRMGELIDDLIGLSRLSRSELTLTRVDLSSLGRSILEELRSQRPDRTVTTTVHDGLVACADPRFADVLLRNLLGNAWKFTGKRAAAEIELGRTHIDGEELFFVRDNGAGFDMRYADKLFGAFQRLHAMDEFDGTGIGLATVKRVVNRHGGIVRAEAAIDRGATFYFTLAEDNCE